MFSYNYSIILTGRVATLATLIVITEWHVTIATYILGCLKDLLYTYE